ncbi:hypothetical protein CGC56_01990 [Capnocytophaga canimorsus]|uniref:Uncharacterized protein n=2 Tax=Capnocytophaga canimorsus TaxID=28188 RepID=A0A250G473_9FLAO|nr:hypothetical protein CGC56_01990 [Capnocytophaga canimorsus]
MVYMNKKIKSKVMNKGLLIIAFFSSVLNIFGQDEKNRSLENIKLEELREVDFLIKRQNVQKQQVVKQQYKSYLNCSSTQIYESEGVAEIFIKNGRKYNSVLLIYLVIL